MVRCDGCGEDIPFQDFEKGAVKAILDQIETESLCITCNRKDELNRQFYLQEINKLNADRRNMHVLINHLSDRIERLEALQKDKITTCTESGISFNKKGEIVI